MNKVSFSRGSFILLILVIFVCLLSCGLPDVVPQINKPALTLVSNTIYTLSSADVKSDGNPFTIYGVNIYYKIYKSSTGAQQFTSDYDAISKVSGDPQNSLTQYGFINLVKKTTTGTTDYSIPTIPLQTNLTWAITMDFSTGQKSSIDISLGTTISTSVTQLYRFIKPDTAKGFSTVVLTVGTDSDLSHLKSDAAFNASAASFGVICYVFAQDFDWSYTPLYSSPTKLGIFDIH